MDVDLVGARHANLGLIVLWCNRRVALRSTQLSQLGWDTGASIAVV